MFDDKRNNSAIIDDPRAVIRRSVPPHILFSDRRSLGGEDMGKGVLYWICWTGFTGIP